MEEWNEHKLGDVFAYLKSGKGIHANEISPKREYILSSLDDKIELNRRINDNLELQAQALFKSWL